MVLSSWHRGGMLQLEGSSLQVDPTPALRCWDLDTVEIWEVP